MPKEIYSQTLKTSYIRHNRALLLILLIFAVSACSNNQTSTYWISGFKTQCESNSSDNECLLIIPDSSFSTDQWDVLTQPINNFTFIEGVTQKALMRVQTNNNNQAATSEDSRKYELIQTLEQQNDTREAINGDWNIQKISGQSVQKTPLQPTFNVDLNQLTISGVDGCNQYQAKLDNLGLSDIRPMPARSTKKMCLDMTTPNQIQAKLDQISNYTLNNFDLVLNDDHGKELFRLMRPNNLTILNDIWAFNKLSAINKQDNSLKNPPQFEINVSQKTLRGFDGCNQFKANITTLNQQQMSFGPIMSSKMLCPDMKLPTSFMQSLSQTAWYKLEPLQLHLYDQENQLLIIMKKVD